MNAITNHAASAATVPSAQPELCPTCKGELEPHGDRSACFDTTCPQSPFVGLVVRHIELREYSPLDEETMRRLFAPSPAQRARMKGRPQIVIVERKPDVAYTMDLAKAASRAQAIIEACRRVPNIPEDLIEAAYNATM